MTDSGLSRMRETSLWSLAVTVCLVALSLLSLYSVLFMDYPTNTLLWKMKFYISL